MSALRQIDDEDALTATKEAPTVKPSSRTNRRMSLGGHIAVRRLALLTGLAAIGLLLIAGPAAAESPWWQITSGARPAAIDPSHGHAGESEVQKILVHLEGGKGGFELSVGSTNLEYFLYPESYANEFSLPAATAANLESALEGPYGAGNVSVTENHEGETVTFTVTSPSGPPLVVGEAGVGGTAEGEVVNPGTAEVPDGEIYLTVTNIGDQSLSGAPTPVTITDALPAGLEAVGIAGTQPFGGGVFLKRTPIPCEAATLSCTFTKGLSPFNQIEVRIAVNVKAGAGSGELNHATVSGGEGYTCAAVAPGTGNFKDIGCQDDEPGAGGFERTATGPVPAASVARPVPFGAAVPYGVESYELRNEEEGGGASSLAGSHPFQSTTTITLNQTADGRPLENPTHKPSVNPIALPKDLHFLWPPGMIGDPTATATCSISQFFKTIASGGANACPPSSAIGVALVTVNEPSLAEVAEVPVPLFNLERKVGEPARFGFNVTEGNTPVVIDTALRSDGDYGVTVETNNITQTAALISSTVSVWGAPGDPRHNNQRGWGCLYQYQGAIGVELPACLATATEPGSHPPAFLTLPTSCMGGAQTTVVGDTWVNPLAVEAFPQLASFAFPTFEGCNQLGFAPKLSLEPTVKSAASSSGLNLDLNFINEGLGNAGGRAESAVKRVTVALPKGVTTNPAVANGLSACTLAQYNAEELGVQSCPESAKVGEVEIESPLVDETVDGAIYVAKQHDNPADNLLSIYMVAKNPNLGVLVKSAGAITPDPQTGQLMTTFDELPQLPFRHFHLSFPGGGRAPLITPGLCGKYTTQADLYPYSNPGVAVHREATFTVDSGANGGPCAGSESQLPNKPTLEAGTLKPIAGAYSPFVFKVNREDGSQALSTISATLPEGLLGKLAGITECSNAAIAHAESLGGEGQGAVELTSPSCPASSQVGVVNAGTGAGPLPYVVSGKAYLAGPYKGAPLSLAIITPAVVGPFDLGNVVIRTALYVNQETAQIHAVSDPIPQILHGLPTVLRSVSLNMNRPDFTFNPTSCDPLQILGSATSTLGSVAPLQERFQVGACDALGFKPRLALRLRGSVKRTANPKLIADVTFPKQGDYSNIARAQVKLPKAAFLDNAHIGTVCTRPDFAAHKCPAGSVYGKAKAISPLLDAPLQGNVYLRANPAHTLPDLVADLNGQIEVALAGKTDSVKGALRNTFEAVPDAPVTSFHLELFGGKRGLIEISAGFCKSPRATVKLTAHNGKTYDTNPVVKSSCGGKKKHHR